ncbi:hypothetical protein ERD78_11825 [Allopusillimonas soli]|uniref:Uncharacterized protein n=1 Tax=Allopusillimonas soli TaxID=659016 RepID=A0A853FC68_9BURK|nr:hypothetical protein [Allopusillimonas soli]NYT37358.1 hypothetical protein [Allopusillimonas soli]TEA74660.1 hypothetical protein ERD78_11825 [Allopusillimonas soli]
MKPLDLAELARGPRIVEDNVLTDVQIDVIPYIVSMLGDDEALEGVEAWLNQQELGISMGSRNAELEADMFVESSAGWLLRLVQLARVALAGDDASPSLLRARLSIATPDNDASSRR